MAAPDVPRVTYIEKPGGDYDIIVGNPNASELRIQGYPEPIQVAAQQDFHATLTLEETRKLRAAQDIGEPAYTAVWDDLLSKRADALLRDAPLPGRLENGRDDITSQPYPSYKDADLERGG